MSRTRRVVAYPGAIGAGASLGVTNVTTPDDNFAKTLKSVYVNPPTFNVEVVVLGAGYQFEDFDASRCSNGNWPVHAEEPFPAYIQFQYNVINHTGGSYTGSITFEYEPAIGAGGVSKSPLG
jgi:hypothetical protein